MHARPAAAGDAARQQQQQQQQQGFPGSCTSKGGGGGGGGGSEACGAGTCGSGSDAATLATKRAGPEVTLPDLRFCGEVGLGTVFGVCGFGDCKKWGQFIESGCGDVMELGTVFVESGCGDSVR